ncbi:MAG: sulfatase [Sedimentisphaerales bacterium]|nr:sulfatase [Sedimentisphaerales bacterium]
MQIRRREFLKLLGATVVSAGVGGIAARGGGGAASKPNVVLILVDDMGWSDVVCNTDNHYFETPNIDSLASEGMRFTNAYAACAVCSPTRASVMTGRYPARIGITDWIRPSEATVNPEGYEGDAGKEVLCPKNHVFLEPEDVTIAEVVRPLGYATCHVGKWHLGGSSFYPTVQGFDYNIGGTSAGQPPGYFDPYSIATLPNRSTGEYLTDREADEAAGFIENAVSQGKGFFLYMAHYAVHSPIQAKVDVIAKYEAKGLPAGLSSSAQYAAMVESVDDAVGTIMAKIDELGIRDDTIVIFTSDNGGESAFTDNSPLRAGKGYPYEGGIREPWIVRWPGVVTAGSVCSEPVITIDIMPTICEAIGVRLPAGRVVDGVSIMPLLRQSGTLRRQELFWHFPHYRYSHEVPYSIIRRGRWKLIKRYAGDKKHELFNLEDDPYEQSNLADSRRDKVKELEERLGIWLRHTKAKIPIPNPDYADKAEKKQVRIG